MHIGSFLVLVALLATAHLIGASKQSHHADASNNRRRKTKGQDQYIPSEEPRGGSKKRRRTGSGSRSSGGGKHHPSARRASAISVDEHGDESLLESTTATATNEVSSDELNQSGYDYLSNGDYANAVEMFGLTHDHYGLSLSYTALKDYAQAVLHATEALKENPSVATLYFQRSRVAGFLGLYDTQIEDMHALLALGTEVEMLESHADSFRRTNYFSAALRAYDMLLELTSDPVTISKYSLHMAQCYDDMGEAQLAYDAIRRALSIDSASVDPAMSSKLPRYLLEMGRIEDARALSVNTIKAIEEEIDQLSRDAMTADGEVVGVKTERTQALMYTLSKHLRVAVVMFQELGDPAMALKYAAKIKFGGGIDFVGAVVAIDSYQAIGNFPAAISMSDQMIATVEHSELRGLFRYRREIASISYCLMDTPFSTFNIDTIVDSRIKYARTRVFGITDEFVPMHSYTDIWQKCASRRVANEVLYNSDALQDTGVIDMLTSFDTPQFRQAVHTLSEATIRLRSSMQLKASGFYVHQRKDRMMGFSTVAMNQLVRQHIQCKLNGYSGLFVSSAGASKSDMVPSRDVGSELLGGLSYPSTCGHAEPLRKLSTSSVVAPTKALHMLEWRDMFDIGVRWRQLAEPTDPVWWTDRFKEFTDDNVIDLVSTPVVTGAKKVGRYYTYYNDSFALFKKTMRHCYGVDKSSVECIRLSPSQMRSVDSSTKLGHLYAVSGQKDEEIYIIANCTSAVNSNRAYPCTKLMLCPAKNGGEGWEFRISATVSTSSYEAYYGDMDVIFQLYINKLVELRSTDSADIRYQLAERIVDDVLDLMYSWIHCSPLTRGSAALAYTSGVAMLLAAGICLDGKFPEDKQLDWEILTSTTPRDFKARVRPWFDAMKRYPLSSECPELTPNWLEGSSLDYSIADLFPTPRHILGALSMKL